MTNEDNNEAVTISLGQIEMKANDLISLRPGFEICFDFESGLEGTLLLAGCDWAKFSAQIDDRGMTLKIKEICAF